MFFSHLILSFFALFFLFVRSCILYTNLLTLRITPYYANCKRFYKKFCQFLHNRKSFLLLQKQNPGISLYKDSEVIQIFHVLCFCFSFRSRLVSYIVLSARRATSITAGSFSGSYTATPMVTLACSHSCSAAARTSSRFFRN